MKKVKQILALIGVILLVALYVTTLILAITDNSGTMNMFFASVVATIMIPVLIWAYTLIYRLTRGNKASDEKNTDSGKGK